MCFFLSIYIILPIQISIIGFCVRLEAASSPLPPPPEIESPWVLALPSPPPPQSKKIANFPTLNLLLLLQYVLPPSEHLACPWKPVF